MRFLSVCSGIEAASVAWEPLGWQASGFAEIEPFPCAVLAHHYPDVPNHGDMTLLPAKIRAGEVEAPDLLCGGTPCQAFSVAGLRQSLDDARGNLTLTFCEIADAIDAMRKQPSIVFWENVPGVLNTKDNAFGCFLGALAGEDDALVAPGGRWANAGFVDGPQRAVAWRVLDAQYFGVAQRRRRVFVVASARADFDPAAVLFEFEGVRRDTAPSREAGQAAARSAAFSAGNSSNARGIGYVEEGTPPLRAGASGTNQVPTCITAARMVAFGEYVDDDTASAMKARDYKDATDLVAQPIAFQSVDHGADATENLSPTLRRHDPMAVAQPIAFEPGKLKRLGYGDAEPGLSPTLRADAGDNQLAVAQPMTFAQNTRDEVRYINGDGAIAGALAAESGMKQTNYVHQAMAVRRLTPVECERLQGFPDNYTNIPWRKADQSPDGPRYKALGNSWAVPVVRWIGERIERSLG
jgi:DNA (cytosine-5)-methyltransferase 1